MTENGSTQKIRFEVQRRYPNSVGYTTREWHTADYVKPGHVAQDLVFKTEAEARKSKAAMTRRSKAYGWGAEYRVVKVVTTYEVIN